jgi:hypothetical protein
MRLPINPILYLVSAGLLGASGWLFQQTLTARKSRPPVEIKDEAEQVVQRGRKLEPEGLTDRYKEDSRPYWMQFKDINLTGKLPPPVEGPQEQQPVQPIAPPVVPIHELLTVAAILAGGSQDTLVVIRYKPTAGVEPPLPPSGASVSIGGPRDTVAAAPVQPTERGGNVPLPRGAPPPAALDPTLKLVHTMRLEDKLWPPHDNIRLIRIGDDANSVVFLREDPTKDRKEWTEERVVKDSLDLGTKLMQALSGGGAARPPANGEGQGDAPDVAPAPPMQVEGYAWQDAPDGQTWQDDRGHIHIGSKDQQVFEQDPNQLMEQVGLRDYQSKSGRITGVQVRQVPRELARYGLVTGDVVISVNGTPVRNRAEGIKVGKEEYRKGVRSFDVRLWRAGREITLTYHSSK